MKFIAVLLFISIVNISADEAHIHGHANLQISYQDDTLFFNLELPGADFSRVEHEVTSKAELERLTQAVESLKSRVNELIDFDSSRSTRTALIDNNLDDIIGDGVDSLYGHDDDGHDDDGHDDDGHDDDGHDEIHRYNIELELLYSMDNIDSLEAIDLKVFFELLPKVEQIEWVMVGHGISKAGVIKPGRTQIKF